MAGIKKGINHLHDLFNKIADDDLFLLSSSVSYYSALGLAPFLIIVLGVAGWMGTDTKFKIIQHARASYSHEVSEIIRLVFVNAEEGLRIGSVSGILGTLAILFTASLVFTRFRYSFDVIYGYRTDEFKRSFLETLVDKLFAMVVVLGGAALLTTSLALVTYVELLFGPGVQEPFLTRLLVLIANLGLYLVLFTGLHHIAPSRRPKITDSLKMAALSSVFFVLGNFLLTIYLKTVAANSVYGAAGVLLVFLVWAFYSSFTIFLSAEVFLFYRTVRSSSRLQMSQD